MMGIDWGTVSMVAMAIVAVGGMVTGVARAAIHHTLRSTYATTDQLNGLHERVQAIEQRVAQMPTHQDIQTLGVRLGGVEQNTAATREAIDGLKDALKGVSHMMNLLISAKLKEEEGTQQ